MLPLRIATLQDVERIEETPLSRRLPWTSVGQMLESVAQQHPDATAWIYVPNVEEPDRVVRQTHAEFNQALRKSASLWRRLADLHTPGVKPVVACLLHHCPQAHHVIWSAECAGIALPVNPMLEIDHIAGLLRSAQASVMVLSRADAQIWNKASQILALAPCVKTVVAVRDDAWAPALPLVPMAVPVLDWDDTLASETAAQRLDMDPGIDAQSSCAYFHTGGTTGTPKLARQHHGGQVYDNGIQAAMYGLGPGKLVVAGLPLFHVAGLTLTGLTPLCAGACLLMIGGGWRNKKVYPGFWKLVERFGVTHLSVVPTVLATLLDTPVDASVASLELVWCGAAALPPALHAQFEQHIGVPVIEGYGATELHCVATQNPLHGPRRTGSVGLRLPYQKLRVVAQDSDLSGNVGPVGRLQIKGPNVFSGYIGVAPEQQPVDAEGWYDTGDLARIDDEGYVWLVGRSRDLIIRGGHNIDPAPIEEVLSRHPAVDSVAVVARPDPHAGEIPVAFVKLRTGQSVSTETLLAHVRAHATERAGVPDWIEVLPELPQTAVGKLAKNKLRARAAELAIKGLLDAAGIGFHGLSATDSGHGIQAILAVDPDQRTRAETTLERLSVHITLI